MNSLCTRPGARGQSLGEVSVPILKVESVGDSLGFSVCVPVVLPSVLVVTVPLSNVNVVCEVLFSD